MSAPGPRRRFDLRARLALTIAGVGLLALLINALLLSIFLNAYLIDRQGTVLAKQVSAVSHCCSPSGQFLALHAPQILAHAMDSLLAGTPQRLAIVIGPKGGILYASAMPTEDRATLLADLHRDLRRPVSTAAATWHQDGDQIISDVRIAVGQPALGEFGGLLLADPVDAVGAQWQRVVALVVVAGGVALALAVLAGAVAAQVLSRALRAVTFAVRSVADGDYSARVNPIGPTETVELADAFNRMIDEVLHQRQVERDLLANVSHELAGPLGLIQGYTEALADQVITGERERHAALVTIRSETARLRRLTGDLLDLALLETGQVSLVLEPVPITQLLAGLRERFAPLARDGGIQLAVEGPEDLPPVWTDGLRLEAVLVNLLRNALQHTPRQASIRLQAAARDGQMQVLVTDTGCGISPEDVPRVWERFYRAERGRDRRQAGGLGLGLAICRSSIALLGGTIDVESTVGQGTTFRICLPLRPGEQR